MATRQNGRTANGGGPTTRPTVRVESLDKLAKKYDFTPPDRFVGPESSQFLLDYGEPVVLADSRRKPHRARREHVWKRLLPRH